LRWEQKGSLIVLLAKEDHQVTQSMPHVKAMDITDRRRIIVFRDLKNAFAAAVLMFSHSQNGPNRKKNQSPKMKTPIESSFLLLSLGSICANAAPPNILFIFADDWGWGDLGCHGQRPLHRPLAGKNCSG
jgi:hypothetical protein